MTHGRHRAALARRRRPGRHRQRRVGGARGRGRRARRGARRARPATCGSTTARSTSSPRTTGSPPPRSPSATATTSCCRGTACGCSTPSTASTPCSAGPARGSAAAPRARWPLPRSTTPSRPCGTSTPGMPRSSRPSTPGSTSSAPHRRERCHRAGTGARSRRPLARLGRTRPRPAGTSARCCARCGCSRSAIPDELPVVAWSAGAMVLTERVVLFGDFGPEGASEAEVYDRGLGRVPGVVALPHARRRLRLDDHDRCAAMARRFVDRHCLLLDDGTALDFARRRCPAARRAGARARRLGPRDARGAGVSGRLAINRLRDRLPVDGRGPRPLRRPARLARRRGRARDVPLPRARPTRCGSGTASWGCPTRSRCAGCPTPTCGSSRPTCPAGRGSSTSSRPAAATTTRPFNDPLNPTARPLAGGLELGLRGHRVRGAGLGAARPGGAAGRAGRGRPARPRRLRRDAAGAALPAGALQPGPALPAPRRPRRHRLPRLRVDEDGARQPHPPARRRAAGRGLHPAAATGCASTPTTPRTRASSPASCCPPSPSGCRSSTAPTAGASWGRASAGSRRCRRRCATRGCSARCCCSRRRSSSPTSAPTTAAARRSTRWSSSSTATAPSRPGPSSGSS